MSSNDAGNDQIPAEQEDPETDMTDPESYGSLSIEDPDGDEQAPAEPSKESDGG